MQCACATLSYMACPALLYFSTAPHKRHEFFRKVIEHKMCFDFLYKFCLKHFSFHEELAEIWSRMYIGLHVNYPLFMSAFNETLVSGRIFEKHSNVIFHGNSSSGSRVIPCGQTDMTKLTVAFRNFANEPKTGIVT
jgi:hypothetical protein